jgi:hypothetical protein
VLWKQEIEKAYNPVNWEFLLYPLSRCGFEKKWRGWIAHYITVLSWSMELHQTSFLRLKTMSFNPAAFFVVVMEALSRILFATMDRRLLSGFPMGSKNNNLLLLPHLLFADDTLILCEANPDHLRNLWCTFLCFEVVSRWKINLVQSKSVPGLVLACHMVRRSGLEGSFPHFVWYCPF